MRHLGGFWCFEGCLWGWNMRIIYPISPSFQPFSALKTYLVVWYAIKQRPFNLVGYNFVVMCVYGCCYCLLYVYASKLYLLFYYTSY